MDGCGSEDFQLILVSLLRPWRRHCDPLRGRSALRGAGARCEGSCTGGDDLARSHRRLDAGA